MFRITRILIALATALGLGSSAVLELPVDGVDEPPRATGVIAVEATPSQRAHLAEVVASFEQAGLGLPAIDVYFHDGTGPCFGNAGLHRPASERDNGVARVDMCNRLPFFVVHELAHAWAAVTMTDETRQATLDHWGLDAWNDAGDEWGKRGTEMVAQTIAYALTIDGDSPSEDVTSFLCSVDVVTGGDHAIAVHDDCAVAR